MTELSIDELHWATLLSYLLPEKPEAEEAAFLFGDRSSNGDTIHVASYQLLTSEDFVSREMDYLELDDRCRAALIKRAHDTNTCLIEVHSHPGPFPAAFSRYDFSGLRETVPHMHWRLREQPYCAIVVAKGSFDALIWHHSVRGPSTISGIKAGPHFFRPTNISLGLWNE